MLPDPLGQSGFAGRKRVSIEKACHETLDFVMGYRDISDYSSY
jgi:hypothetical protein